MDDNLKRQWARWAIEAEPRGARVAEYVFALIALILFAAWIGDESFPTEQAVAQERAAEMLGCIAQYGPGELHRNPQFKCAPMVEAPANAMTTPVGGR